MYCGSSFILGMNDQTWLPSYGCHSSTFVPLSPTSLSRASTRYSSPSALSLAFSGGKFRNFPPLLSHMGPTALSFNGYFILPLTVTTHLRTKVKRRSMRAAACCVNIYLP